MQVKKCLLEENRHGGIMFVCTTFESLSMKVCFYLTTLLELHYVSINLLEFFTKYRSCVLQKIKQNYITKSNCDDSPDLFCFDPLGIGHIKKSIKLLSL